VRDWNKGPEIKKWIPFSQLCRRWDINEYDLASIVIEGKLDAYDSRKLFQRYTVSEDDGSYLVTTAYGAGGFRKERLTVDDVKDFIFSINEVVRFEKENAIAPHIRPQSDAMKDEQIKEQHCIELEQKILEGEQKPISQTQKSLNFFTKESSGLWHIGFGGQETRIKHRSGFQYIAILLEKRCTSISCRALYQAAVGTVPDNTISEGAAIDQGLNIGSSKQEIIDQKAKENYWERYRELQNEIENAESDLERNEIEREIEEMLPYLKERSFADPDEKKAQANVTKGLKTAYDSIRSAGMQELAKHLQDYVKPNGNYGLCYTGTITWESTNK